MKKYNSFILEQIKEITNDAATDYLNNLIGYKPENSIFYRSDEKLYGEFYLIKTHKRESRTRNNLQNIILSQNDYMPDRIKSISFSTFDVAKSFGDEFNLLNHIYQLIPENNVKIVICPNKDLNKYPAYKIVQEFFKLDYAKSFDFDIGQFEFFTLLRKSLGNFFSSYTFDWSNINKDNFKKICDSIDTKIRIDGIPKDGGYICNVAFFDLFYKPFIESDKSFYNYILETFDPIKNGFKVVDFNWNKMEDATFRKQFENKECYFDGTCLLKLID
jgi:hypothetical protein